MSTALMNVLEWHEVKQPNSYVYWEAKDGDGARHVIVDRARCPGLPDMELSVIDDRRYSLHTYRDAGSGLERREDVGCFPDFGDVFEALGCNGRFHHQKGDGGMSMRMSIAADLKKARNRLNDARNALIEGDESLEQVGDRVNVGVEIATGVLQALDALQEATR